MDEIVVIGAGIVGAACAAALVMAGHKVTVIDKALPGHGCSFGNAGGLSPGISFPLASPGMFKHIPGWLMDSDGPLVVSWKHMPIAAPWLMKFLREGTAARSGLAAQGIRQLMSGSFEHYAPLFEFSGAEKLIHRVGQLYLYSTDEAFEEEKSAIKVRSSLGVEQEVLGGADLRQMEPYLSARFKHGIHFPTHGHCSDPQGLVQHLIDACLKNGAAYISGSVTRLVPENDGINVYTSQGLLRARQVVVAAGLWSAELVRALGWSVPMESQRGYHIQIPNAGVQPTRNVMWAERKTLVTPMDGGLRVAGTAEIAGVAAPPTPRRFELLKETVQQVYPDVVLDSNSEWMGHRPCTPDSLPVIGRLPNHPRVICAFGHGHVGLTGASFTASAVRDLITYDKSAESLEAFAIDRF